MISSDFRAFKNVLHEELGTEWRKLLEASYLVRFFECLRQHMGESFEQFRFLIINKNSRWSRIEPPIKGKDVVLLWLGDEEGIIPHELSGDFRLILNPTGRYPSLWEICIHFHCVEALLF
jgi:hypothetical protein